MKKETWQDILFGFAAAALFAVVFGLTIIGGL